MDEKSVPLFASPLRRPGQTALLRSIVVVAGRTNPAENKRLFHSYDVKDGKGAKTNHQQNKIRKGHRMIDTQDPKNGSQDKPHGWHTDQYPERGPYCDLGLFSHAQRPPFTQIRKLIRLLCKTNLASWDTLAEHLPSGCLL
jgi:hypothetical protein